MYIQPSMLTGHNRAWGNNEIMQSPMSTCWPWQTEAAYLLVNGMQMPLPAGHWQGLLTCWPLAGRGCSTAGQGQAGAAHLLTRGWQGLLKCWPGAGRGCSTADQRQEGAANLLTRGRQGLLNCWPGPSRGCSTAGQGQPGAAQLLARGRQGLPTCWPGAGRGWQPADHGRQILSTSWPVAGRGCPHAGLWQASAAHLLASGRQGLLTSWTEEAGRGFPSTGQWQAGAAHLLPMAYKSCSPADHGRQGLCLFELCRVLHEPVCLPLHVDCCGASRNKVGQLIAHPFVQALGVMVPETAAHIIHTVMHTYVKKVYNCKTWWNNFYTLSVKWLKCK